MSTFTASMEIVEVANPPVELVFPGPMEMDGTGWMVESFFDVFVEINLPVGPEGWIVLLNSSSLAQVWSSQGVMSLTRECIR